MEICFVHSVKKNSWAHNIFFQFRFEISPSLQSPNHIQAAGDGSMCLRCGGVAATGRISSSNPTSARTSKRHRAFWTSSAAFTRS